MRIIEAGIVKSALRLESIRYMYSYNLGKILTLVWILQDIIQVACIKGQRNCQSTLDPNSVYSDS